MQCKWLLPTNCIANWLATVVEGNNKVGRETVLASVHGGAFGIFFGSYLVSSPCSVLVWLDVFVIPSTLRRCFCFFGIATAAVFAFPRTLCHCLTVCGILDAHTNILLITLPKCYLTSAPGLSPECFFSFFLRSGCVGMFYFYKIPDKIPDSSSLSLAKVILD